MMPTWPNRGWRFLLLAVLMSVPVIALWQRLVFNTGDPRLARVITLLTMSVVGWRLTRLMREREP